MLGADGPRTYMVTFENNARVAWGSVGYREHLRFFAPTKEIVVLPICEDGTLTASARPEFRAEFDRLWPGIPTVYKTVPTPHFP